MFFYCSTLKKLNLKNLNTYNVIYIGDMFSGCKLLKEVNIDEFIITNPTYETDMFQGCPKELVNKINSIRKNK